MRIKLFILLGLMVFFAFIWSMDAITLQGERTIYTTDCNAGRWESHKCTGKLTAGSRYRYRALKAHGEVFFWAAGSTEPSGKFVNCLINDGRNWSCPATNPDAGKSVTLALVHGCAVSDPSWPTRPLHPVSKVTWYLLKIGVSLGHSDDPAAIASEASISK